MAGLAAGLLAPLGTAWDAASRMRRAMARPYRAPVPVICVGNLVAGGAGKTPVVLALAGTIAATGVTVHIVSRGYGGRLGGPVGVDPAAHDAAAVGDEALLLAERAPCWVARDRAAGVRDAVAAGAGAILLDDGFQNPGVEKDLSLVVVDAEYGFGNRRVIPAGPLREPVAAGLARADAVVLIGDGAAPLELREAGLPIFRAELAPVRAAPFAGARVVAFAGIGHPENSSPACAGPARPWPRFIRSPITIPMPRPKSPGCGARRNSPAPTSSRPPRIGCACRRGCATGLRCSRSRSAGMTRPRWRSWWPAFCRNPQPDPAMAPTEAPLKTEAPAAPVSWSHRIEACGAALFFAAMRALPIDAASGLGGALARHIGPRLGISQRARRNLAAALPELSAAEIERIVRGMWDNLGRVAAEYPHLPRIRVFPPDGPAPTLPSPASGGGSGRGQIRVFPPYGRVETAGIEHLDRAIAAGRPVIIFGGHLGNWEIAALAAGQYGIDVAQIYRAANNPLVERMIARFRGTASEFIPKGAVASRRALAALRRGAHLTLLVDQKLNDGIPVKFFGRAAMTAPALALLALHFDCAVLPARVERVRGAHFRLTLSPPLALPQSGERAADAAALMAEVNRTLESWVRERPEQWFWVHSRWPD